MSTKHEIVLIDGGDDIGPGSSASPGPMPSRPASPGSAPSSRPDSGSGRRSREKEPESKTDSAWGLASAISKAMGGIALVDTAVRLKKAFEDIYAAVTKLDSRLEKVAEKEPGGSSVGTSGSAPTSRPSRKRSATKAAEPEDDFIEGEFTVSRPASAPEVSERGLSVRERGMSVPDGADDAMGALTKRAAGAAEVGASRTAVVGSSVVEGGAAAAAPAAEGLGAVAAAAGPLGIALAGITVAAVAGGIALKALFDTLSNEVKRLENASAEVNVATSMTEVRREMADLRRADQIGPDLARFENVRSKAEDKLADLYTEVLKVLLNIFQVIEPGIQVVTNGIVTTTAGVELANANLEIIADMVTGQVQELAQDAAKQQIAAVKFLSSINNLMKLQAEDKEDFDDPFLKGFLGQFGAGGQL